jgi:DNA processing protein
MIADAVDRLRLIRTPTIGPITYRQLMARFGTAAAALAALPDLAARGRRQLTVPGVGEAEAEIARLEALGAEMIFIGTPAYPSLLAATEAAPPMLAARGRLALLERASLSVVGARNASAAGVRLARRWAGELAARELVITSGLARGIDTAAHEGAVEGGTVAVIAGGIDVAYPPENAKLMDRLVEEGLVLAEQPPGVQPQARHFPRRNRIIAGLSAGTLVVEAAPRSGSLITARLAADYGREVIAVPGSPVDPRAQGCNQLIREGATLVQSASDVIEALSAFDADGGGGTLGARFQLAERAGAYEVSAEAPAEARGLLQSLLSPAPVAIDELVRQSGLSAAVAAHVLLDMELEGMVERHAGGRVALA